MNTQFLVTNRAWKDGKWSNEHGPMSFGTKAKDVVPQEGNSYEGWTTCTSAEFLQRLNLIAAPYEQLLFVHGFNNGEEKAAATAQCVADNCPEHAVITFSWISEGNIAAYEQDRGRARASADDLYMLLQILGPQVNVVAHSMGNYVFQEAMSYAEKGKVIVDHLAMVAGDVDNTAPQGLKQFVNKGYVFYCPLDGALGGSTILHSLEANGLPRLGLTGPIVHPANFDHKEFLFLGQLDPIAKHGQYFRDKGFYTVLNKFLGGE